MHRTTLARSMWATGLAALAASAMAPAASAVPIAPSAPANATLVRTLDPSTRDGAPGIYPTTYATTGAASFFAARDGVHGQELWTTDASGTRLVTDLTPGSQSTNFDLIGAAGAHAFVLARLPGKNAELYRTDGTGEGTVPITAAGGAPITGARNFVTSGDDVFFFTQEALWKVPASSSLATKVVDEGAGADFRDLVAVAGGTIIFTRGNGSLYSRTSGGAVTEISHQRGGSLGYATSLVRSGDDVFAQIGEGLYLVNPEGGGAPTQVALPQSAPPLGDGTYYGWSAPGAPGELLFGYGTSLYRTDGAAATEVATGLPANGPLYGAAFFGGGKLYLNAADDRLVVADLDGSAVRPLPVRYPRSFAAGPGGVVYTSGGTEEGDSQIFRTDGTVGGTVPMIDPSQFKNRSVYGPFARPGAAPLFVAQSKAVGYEPFALPETPGAPATLLRDIDPAPRGASLERTRVSFGDQAVFATNEDEGEVLYLTDGTTAGTRPLFAEDSPFAGDELVSGVAVGEDAVAFLTDRGKGGDRLLLFDGTIREITASDDESAGNQYPFGTPAVIGSTIFYAASGPVGSRNSVFFRSSGGAVGTPLALPAGLPAGASADTIVPFGDQLLATYGSYANGHNASYLYVVDPATGASTQLGATTTGYFPLEGSAVHGGRLYLSQLTDEGATRLLSTDGTPAGTRIEGQPGPGGYPYPAYTKVGSSLLVRTGEDQDNDVKIQRLNASGDFVDVPLPAGADRWVNPDRASGVVASGAAGFTLINRTSGERGVLAAISEAGVATDLDVTPNTGNNAGPLVDVNGKLFFGSDGEFVVPGEGPEFGSAPGYGEELWTSDGTPDGTKRVTDLNPGYRDGLTGAPFRAGDHVLFSGDDGVTGFQLFASDGPKRIKPVTPTPTPSPSPSPTPSATPSPDGPPATPTPAPVAVPAPTPTPTKAPTPAPPGKVDPRAVPAKVEADVSEVKETRKSFAFDIDGTVLGAKGLRTRAECRGQVQILVTATTRKGKGKTAKTITKTLAKEKVKLTWVKGACTYDRTIVIAKSKVPAGAQVEATVTYLGSRSQKPKTGQSIEIELS